MSLLKWLNNKLSPKKKEKTPSPKQIKLRVASSTSKQQHFRAHTIRKKRQSKLSQQSTASKQNQTDQSQPTNSKPNKKPVQNNELQTPKSKQKQDQFNDQEAIDILAEIEDKNIDLNDKNHNFKLDIVIHKHLQHKC